jgi:hypothetical protein
MHGICANNNPSCAEPLKKAFSAGSRAFFGNAPRCYSRTKSLLRSAKGRMSGLAFRPAHELPRISADIHSDSSLHLKSQTTNCED